MNYFNLLEIIKDQKSYFESFLKNNQNITRNINFNKYITSKEIIVITGSRRSGKSYLLLQFKEKIKRGSYVNFEDDRFINFTENDFNNLLKAIYEVYGEDNNTFFFDEIQNIPHWEIFVRRLYNYKYKVFITGSNANLLSSELGTKLTGRHLDITLLPFSFIEYLKYYNVDYNKNYNLKEKSKILRYFDKYLLEGSYPQFLEEDNPDIIRNIYSDAIYKDLQPRYSIDNINDLKETLLYLSSSLASPISYNNVAKSLKIKSHHTIKKYISSLESVYLVFLINRYFESNKKILQSYKKIYFIDNGLRNILTFQRYQDKEHLLENIVFLELIRRGKEITYFNEDNSECDFIAKDKSFENYQVCFELNDNNKDREVKGLVFAMDFFKLKIGYILTYDQEDEFKIDNKVIKVISVWKWLLE
ncbi:MAG: ATP-binding protein [Candidatus ainarchaeum sp.]|nr:ATP-binding protein [Candidatus ainarchaeum sp.]